MLATRNDIINRYHAINSVEGCNHIDIATRIINDYKVEHSITDDEELYALAYFVHKVTSEQAKSE